MKVYIGKDGDGEVVAFSAMPREGSGENEGFMWTPIEEGDYLEIDKVVPELLPGQFAEFEMVLKQVYETDMVKRQK